MRARPTLASFAALAALLLPVLVFPGVDDRTNRPAWERALRRIRVDAVAVDAADQMTAGYYEDLFKHGSRTLSTNRLVIGRRASNWPSWKGEHGVSSVQPVPGFLHFRLTPSVFTREHGVSLITNSFGMADREYTEKRPKGVRRIGLIGDSVAQGLGANAGKNFESLLETALNEMPPAGDIDRYEVLNLAVRGYRVTQMLYVVDEIAPAFEPDAYVVVCSDLTVFRKWGDHIGQLVHDGIDLHYPFLRDLAERAGLRAADDASTLDAKLAPFRTETVRWAMETMRRRAQEEGAEMVVVLAPTVSPAEEIRERFAGIPELFAEMDLPCIDLLDTFEGIEDVEPYRIAPFNQHPTDLGHALLAKRLLEGLRENGRAWSIVADLALTRVPPRE